jgi:hypothetical protein
MGMFLENKSIFIALMSILLFTACSNLKKTFGSSEYNKSYQEKLIAFYSQSEGSSLTFIGKKYNYTFINAKKLINLLKSQNLLHLNPLNMSLNIRVKEYRSSLVTLKLFSHFEKNKLNKKQIKWLESHNYLLEQRANIGAKKSESSKPPRVATYVMELNFQGKRQQSTNHKNSEVLHPIISLEVAEHITR